MWNQCSAHAVPRSCSVVFDRKASGSNGCVSKYFWLLAAAAWVFRAVKEQISSRLCSNFPVGGEIEGVLLDVTGCAAAFCVFSSSKVASQSFPARKKPIYVSKREGSSIFLALHPPLHYRLTSRLTNFTNILDIAHYISFHCKSSIISFILHQLRSVLFCITSFAVRPSTFDEPQHRRLRASYEDPIQT
jgi:hypothetical protein